MSRQLEAIDEQKRERADRALVRSVMRDIPLGVHDMGLVLRGFAVRIDDYETLITLRASRGGQAEIAFVGSATVADALRKAGREAMAGKLSWRADKFVNGRT